MRGEFIAVWSEAWREIWLPILDQDGVPDDIFCQLYDELAAAFREPSLDEAIAIALQDAIQARWAFERALQLTGIEVDLARAEEAFNASLALNYDNPTQREEAIAGALATLTDDTARDKDTLRQALSELVNNRDRRAEALGRRREGIINDKILSKEAFERTSSADFTGERALVRFLEGAYDVIEQLGGDRLANIYFNLLTSFINKFSLRYDLRRPCTLCPTLPGVFASLVADLRGLGSKDAALNELVKDFEEAVRDLRSGPTSGRIKTCITKQVMLLEALTSMDPDVTKGTLGDMCGEIMSWPHPAVRESLKKLYGFASDCPGIRHGKSHGRTKHQGRAMEMRDLVAISILLAGFTPYLSNQLDADVLYRRN